jgi:hypothetical protein
MTPWPTHLVHTPLSEIDMDSQPSRQMVGQCLAADRGKSVNCLDTHTGYSERDFVFSVALYRENVTLFNLCIDANDNAQIYDIKLK